MFTISYGRDPGDFGPGRAAARGKLRDRSCMVANVIWTCPGFADTAWPQWTSPGLVDTSG